MKMDDIARRAGVSKSAVSLAFSGKPGIGDETRERILAIAAAAGYAPKKRGRTPGAEPAAMPGTAQLLFLVIANAGIVTRRYDRQPFFRELIHYVEQGSRQGGFSLLVSTIDMERFDDDLLAIADAHADKSVLLLGTNLAKEALARIAERLPRLIVLDTVCETLPVPFVCTNNALGGWQAASHLLRAGHRRIGYVASDVRIPNFDGRRRGVEEAMREAGLAIAPEHEFAVDPMTPAAQDTFKARVERQRAAGNPLPTALICESDFMAICAIKSLAELGVRVPEEVSVVGFDDIAEAVIVSPELTTVRVNKEAMARAAIRLAADAAGTGSGSGFKIAVDTVLIERSSTAPPPPSPSP